MEACEVLKTMEEEEEVGGERDGPDDVCGREAEPEDTHIVHLTEEGVAEVAREVERRVREVVRQVEGCVERAGPLVEQCLGEVKLLVLQRDVLVAQLLQLEQPMARDVQAVRAELREAQRQLAQVELERRGLHEQVQQVKRRLFFTARDCIQSQVTLTTKQHQVAQFAITQEELNAQIQGLVEEVLQLQEEQQEQLKEVQERARAAQSRRQRPRSDLTYSRRFSLDLQQYLRGGVTALEQRYEPRLLILLRRRQWGQEALRRQREEALDLRAQIRPLQEEVQALELQRACLQERLALTERQREENVAQYRETLEVLEQNVRDLRTEIQVQKNTNQAIETLKNSLAKELDQQRQCVEVYGTLWTPAQESPESASHETLHR